MTDDLTKRQAKAEAATQGRWDLVDGHVLDQDDHEVCVAFRDADAAHIAANSPAEVLRLIEQVREARALVVTYHERARGMGGDWKQWRADAATVAKWSKP